MSRVAKGFAENLRIDSWKGIAAFFSRDERTVKRWEKERALPVYRLPGSERGGVFAYSHELSEWLRTRPSNRAGPARVPLSDGAKPATAVDFDGAAERVSEQLGALPEPVAARLDERSSAKRLFDDLKPLAPPRLRRFAAGAALLLMLVAGGVLVRRLPLQSANINSPRRTPQGHDPSAEELYLKGRYFWNHRTGVSLNQAVDAFTQAIVREPDYAEAYAGLADSYDLMPEYTSMPRSEAFPRAIAAATKAVSLDGSLPEAHRALAFGLFYWSWDVPRSLAEYQRAIELAPNDVEAHHWYATSLLTAGREREALAEIEKARKLDPSSPSILADRDLILDGLGDHAAAIAALKAMEQTEPGFLSPPRYIARIFLEQKRYPEFIAETSHAAALSHDPQEFALAEAAQRGWSRAGKAGMLEQMLRVQQKFFNEGKSSGFELARTYAQLGRKQEAVHYLQAALVAHDYQMFTIGVDPLEAALQDDPGFQELQRQMQAQIAGAGRRAQAAYARGPERLRLRLAMNHIHI